VQLGLALLVVPLLVASTLLVVLLVASGLDQVRRARRALDPLTARLETQRAEITPRFADWRQQLLSAEARAETVREGLVRLDGALTSATTRLAATRTTLQEAASSRPPRRTRRPSRG
jgi:chromosome segregation ATPase